MSRRKFVPNLNLDSKPTLVPKTEPTSKLAKDSNKKKVKFQKEYIQKSFKKTNKIVATEGAFSTGINIVEKTQSNSYSHAKFSTSTVIKHEECEEKDGYLKDLMETLTSDNLSHKPVLDDADIYPVALPLTTRIKSLMQDENAVETEQDTKNQVFIDHGGCVSDVTDICASYFNLNETQDEINTDDKNYFIFQMPAAAPFINMKYDGENESNSLPHNVDIDERFDLSTYPGDSALESEFGEGETGYIQIMNSGRVQLVFGHQTFDVLESTQSCFLQEIFLGTKPEDITDGIIAKIGDVTQKFTCSLNLDDLDL